MKKLFTMFLILLLSISLIGCSNSAFNGYKDGSYTGTGDGLNGPVEVEVEVVNGEISNIVVVSQTETVGLGDVAIEKIVAKTIETNNTNIDSVSGATVSSTAIVTAIRDALTKAGGTKEHFDSEELVSLKTAALEDEYEYDVIVIGAGGAGLSAAIEAAKTGAKVAIVEKTSAAGGNTLVSGGGLNVAGSPQQEKNGVEDSVELFIEDTLKGGDYENDPVLVQVMAEHSLEAATWLQEEIGVIFMEDRLQQFGGHSVPRALISQGNKGDELINKLQAEAESLGVDIYFETTAEALNQIDGRVTSVVVVNNEKETVFHASKGVIIATGGFASNIEMRKEYNPVYDEKFLSTATPGSTGDGIMMAQEVGADLVDMSYIQVYPTCNPETGIISYVANSRFDGAILINQEGKRFVDEMGRRDDISNAIIDQTGGVAYLVWSSEIEEVGHMTDIHLVEYSQWENSDLIYKAESIEDAAAHYNISVEEMQATIDAYNASIADGVDEDYNRGGALRTIEEGPFYIQVVTASTHHTMGGIKINDQAQVLDTNGEVIPGLFAAGEVVGGVHGTNRLGGNAITDIIVFGRIAGQNVVK